MNTLPALATTAAARAAARTLLTAIVITDTAVALATRIHQRLRDGRPTPAQTCLGCRTPITRAHTHVVHLRQIERHTGWVIRVDDAVELAHYHPACEHRRA